MEPAISSLEDLIKRFGGPQAMAARLSAVGKGVITREAVYVWRKRGLPGRWHVPILLEAEKLGIEVDPATLDGFSRASRTETEAA